MAATGMATNATERYIRAAKAAGCPRDQIENFVRAGIVLQPRQLAASAAARLCDAPDGPIEVGYGGARGGGKSHWGIAQVVADDCQRHDGLKALILRKVGKANRENFEDLRRRVLFGVPNEYNRGEGVLYLPNGSRVFLGHFQKESDIDAYLGIEYDIVLIEEATTLTARKRRDIQTCCRTSKPEWRPRMYSTANPGGVGHAEYKQRFVAPHQVGKAILSLGLQTGDTRFIPATVDDNTFVNPEYRKVLDSLTGWQKRAWRYGDWDIAAGQFFTTWSRERHVIPPIAEIPFDWRLWCALDYGFTHYTVVYLLAQSGDGDIYHLAEHAERGWLVERHAAAWNAVLGRHGVPRWRLAAFVAGADVFAKKHDGGTIADQYRAHGFTLTAANTDRINGAAEYLKRLGDVSAGIRPTLYVSESCPRLAECIPSLQHDPHRPEDVLKWDTDEDGVGGDDPYDASRYGVMVVARPASGYGANPLAGYRG
jgi:phage terminase large subunit